jgi:hypothetical protein
VTSAVAFVAATAEVRAVRSFDELDDDTLLALIEVHERGRVFGALGAAAVLAAGSAVEGPVAIACLGLLAPVGGWIGSQWARAEHRMLGVHPSLAVPIARLVQARRASMRGLRDEEKVSLLREAVRHDPALAM